MKLIDHEQGINSEVGFCRPPVESRFKPGRSGNPNGRPKGRSVTAILRQVIEANDGELAERLVRVLVDRALAGDFRCLKEILDRIDGKPATIATNTEGPTEIVVRYVDGSSHAPND